MRNEFQQHKRAYVALVGGLVILALCFLAVWPNRDQQRLVAGLMGGYYFLWGMITHLHTINLTKRVLYEYATIAGLATLLLLLVTF